MVHENTGAQENSLQPIVQGEWAYAKKPPLSQTAANSLPTFDVTGRGGRFRTHDILNKDLVIQPLCNRYYRSWALIPSVQNHLQ